MRTTSRTVAALDRLTPLRLTALSVAAAVVITLVLCNVLDSLVTLRRVRTYSIAAWSCLLAAGAATAALAVWLAVTHRRSYLIPDDLLSDLCERIKEGDYEEAQSVCVTRPQGLPPVLFEALDRLRRGRTGVAEAAIGQCDCERRVLEGRAAWLATLARLTVFFGALASLMVFMDFLARGSCACGLRGFRPHEALQSFVLPLAVSLGIAIPALAVHVFFSRRAGVLAAEIGAVAATVLDHVLSDPRAAAYAEACRRARAEPVFRRAKLDESRSQVEPPRATIEIPALRRRAFTLGRLALSACAASVIVLEVLAALSLVSAQDFMRGALGASFWLVGGLGATGVGLVVVTGITMRRRGRGVSGAPSHERPARVERTAGWLRVIGKTALLAGVLGVVLAMMKEAEAMRTIWFWFDMEGLLARSCAPFALALAVFIFTAVAGRVYRNRARRPAAEVEPVRM